MVRRRILNLLLVVLLLLMPMFRRRWRSLHEIGCSERRIVSQTTWKPQQLV
jgi:hypothetical protein